MAAALLRRQEAGKADHLVEEGRVDRLEEALGDRLDRVGKEAWEVRGCCRLRLGVLEMSFVSFFLQRFMLFRMCLCVYVRGN